MSLPVAYWPLKIVTVLASLAFVALRVAVRRQLGRDPRVRGRARGANPIYIVYAVGGFHNDFFMLVPLMAAIALLAATRGAVAWRTCRGSADARRRGQVHRHAAASVPARRGGPGRRRTGSWPAPRSAAIPLVVLSVALFGLALPNLQDQSTLLTDFSIPNVVGLALGVGGGTPRAAADRRRGGGRHGRAAVPRSAATGRGAGLGDAGADREPGLADALVPGLARCRWRRSAPRPALRRATLAMTVFLVLTFIPATGIDMSNLGIDPMATPAGHASSVLQHKLSR